MNRWLADRFDESESFSRHRLGAWNARLHFRTHLHHRAERAAQVRHYIAHQWAIDAFELPESLSVESAEDDQRKTEKWSQAAQEAAFA